MSNLPGNPHVFEGPQIASPETIENDFIGEEGVTAETMILSELTRNTEATLALAYEQRTANLIALWASPGNLPDGSYDKGMEMSGVNYGDLANQIKTRLGLGDNND